jgi:hypothetical protein
MNKEQVSNETRFFIFLLEKYAEYKKCARQRNFKTLAGTRVDWLYQRQCTNNITPSGSKTLLKTLTEKWKIF